LDVLAHADPFVLEAALLDGVARAKAADPLARVLVLVPTRRLAEHVLRRAAARFGALLGLEVRHHRALVLELLDEAGEAAELAPRAARQQLVGRVLLGLPGNPWASYAAQTPAAVASILSAFEDLREAGIPPDQLDDVVQAGDRPLAEAYRAYHEALAAAAWRGVVDDAGLVEAALPHARARAGQYACILHHGAYELTGVHLELLRALDGPSRVTFLAPFSPGAPATRYAEAFARRHLLAGDAEPRVLPDRPGAVLGPGLPRLWVEEEGAPGPAGAIHLADVQGPEAELTYGLRRALAAVDAGSGVPPSEIAVLARSLAPYRTVLEADVAPLPLTSSLGMPLRRDPYVHDLLLVLEVVMDDFPRARTAEALRSPRLRWGVRAESADAWSLRAGILGGLDAWVEDLPVWAATPRLQEDASDEERAAEEERARERRARAEAIAAALRAVWQEAAPGRLRGFDAHAQTIESLARRMLRPPPGEGAALDDAVTLLGGLRALPRLLGEDHPVPFADAVRAFELAVDGAVRRPLREDGGGIRLLDAMQARGVTFERTVLLGWHADAIPQGRDEDVVLPDRVREALRRRCGRPLPVRAESLDEERLLATSLLASGRRSVDLVRQRADAAGRTRSASPFLREVARLALGKPDLRGLLEQSASLHAGPVGWLADLARRTGGLTEEEGTLHAALVASSPGSLLRALPSGHPLLPGLQLLETTESFTSDDGRFDGRIGTPFAGDRLSASALETLGKCPLRYFFQRVLRVRALEDEPGLDALAGNVLGLAVHEVLERLYARLHEAGALAPGGERADAERVDALLPGIWMDVVGPLCERRARRLPGLWGGLTERWLSALRTFVLEDLEDLRARGTSGIELETLVEADLDLGEGRLLPVRGRLDRLVHGPDGLRIGDYKTGRNLQYNLEPKNLVTGNALQAPLYALLTGATEVELLGIGPAHAGKERSERRLSLRSLGPLEAGFVETLGVLYDLLQHGAYPLNEKGPCGWCEYRRACRRKHPPTLTREETRADARDFRDVKEKTGSQRTTLREVRAHRARRSEVPA
jgi:RecB family exonuclease